jgi:hypothetical protein
MFVRSKVVKGRTYYQMVEGYRDELGRVRHRNIVSLGDCDTVEKALGAEKRWLARSRRELARIFMPDPATIGLKARIERLERGIARIEARVELLKSILAGDVPSVDTTAPETA